ncbi:hypothetical protein BX600DRAFT_246471 [Xylariales sp. PMI_506]|nr:hypothetical protein BX600DRAFT_246471 [Xylariales sp. PMI_506]
MQQIRPSRPPRAERVTTSCSECRRRKQKCNQGHPCSNCARRFPQPPCEYRENRRREEPVPNTSSFIVSLQGRRDDTSLPDFERSFLPVADTLPTINRDGEDSSSLVSWFGIDILTKFPGSNLSNEVISTQWGAIASSNLPDCEPGCAAHSDTLHDAVKLLKYTVKISNDYLASWDPQNPNEDVDWVKAVGGSSDMYTLSSPIELLHSLPIAPTNLNAQLLQIFVKLISRFKASLDGIPDYNNPYHKDYLPFCIQNPLLVHVAIYTASCFLNEMKHLDKTVAMCIKGQAIRLLNDRLRSEEFASSDEAIAGVCQLIVDEWYWGETHDLRAHLRGMREMIRLRGGFQNLGMDGFLSKMVMLTDLGIAVTFEAPPYLQEITDMEMNDRTTEPVKLAHKTPLSPSSVTFASCADAYELHPASASILDDVRFLIALTISLPATPAPQEIQKLESTALWIHERIQALPSDHPPSSKKSQSPPASLPSSRSSTTSGTDSSKPMLVNFTPTADYVYQSIRLAALVYTGAIVSRKPFSKVCSTHDFYQIWSAVWRVPLTVWKSLMGVFLWIEIAIAPSARDTPHGRFVKSMLMIAALNMGIEDWAASNNALHGAILLQEKLNIQGKGKGKGKKKDVKEEQ